MSPQAPDATSGGAAEAPDADAPQAPHGGHDTYVTAAAPEAPAVAHHQDDAEDRTPTLFGLFAPLTAWLDQVAETTSCTAWYVAWQIAAGLSAAPGFAAGLTACRGLR